MKTMKQIDDASLCKCASKHENVKYTSGYQKFRPTPRGVEGPPTPPKKKPSPFAFIASLEHITFHRQVMMGVFDNPIEFESRTFGNKRHDRPSATFADPDLACMMLGDVASIADRLSFLHLHITLNRLPSEFSANHAISQWKVHLYANRIKYVIHVLASVMPLDRISFEVVENPTFTGIPSPDLKDMGLTADELKQKLFSEYEFVFQFIDTRKKGNEVTDVEAPHDSAATRGRARSSWVSTPTVTGPDNGLLEKYFYEQEQAKKQKAKGNRLLEGNRSRFNTSLGTRSRHANW